MAGFIPQLLMDSIPILRGEENIEQWKLKVIQAFAGVGLADYLCASADQAVPTPSPEKLALGLSILEPSLVQQRTYLTKAGWNFNASRQDPKALYKLVLRSITQRALSVTINDDLYKLLRIEMKDQESVDDYIHRVRGLRGCLQNAGHHVDEQLVVRVTLHGMMGGPGKKEWVNRTVRDDLAPGSLTLNKLEKLMLATESRLKKAAVKPVEPAKTATQSGSTQNGAAMPGSVQNRTPGAGDSQPNHVHFGNVAPSDGRDANLSSGGGGRDIIRPSIPRPDITRLDSMDVNGNPANLTRPGIPRLSNVNSIHPDNGRPINVRRTELENALLRSRHEALDQHANGQATTHPSASIQDAMSIDNVLNPKPPAPSHNPSHVQQPTRPPTAGPATRTTAPYPGQAPPVARQYTPTPADSHHRLSTQRWVRIPPAYAGAEEEEVFQLLDVWNPSGRRE